MLCYWDWCRRHNRVHKAYCAEYHFMMSVHKKWVAILLARALFPVWACALFHFWWFSVAFWIKLIPYSYSFHGLPVSFKIVIRFVLVCKSIFFIIIHSCSEPWCVEQTTWGTSVLVKPSLIKHWCRIVLSFLRAPQCRCAGFEIESQYHLAFLVHCTLPSDLHTVMPVLRALYSDFSTVGFP